MLPLRNPPKGRTMLSDRLTLFLALTIFSVSNAAVVFDFPPSGGATVTFPENKAPGEVLYRLQATDAGGNPPVFSLNLINCTDNSAQTQNFTINQLDELIVPPVGLDAENCTQFIFTFNVTAGASHATSGPLTVNVTDINDNPPEFEKPIYSGDVWRNDEQNSLVNNDTIKATDPDKSNLTITYAIAGAQTTFAINVTTGTVYVANPSGLAALASPTMLTIQATDGGLISTATLSITVHDDPCTITPCQNGGTCNSTKDERNCSCSSGYIGDDCEKVNYCFVNYCQNNGNCTSLDSNYSCSCVPEKGGQNCTVDITTTTTTTTTRTTTTTTSISTSTTPSQPTISPSSTTTTPKTQTPRSAATTITATKRDAWLGLGIGLPVACAITIIGAIIMFAQKTKKENYQCQCQSLDVTTKDDKDLHRTQQINL